jgi:hypothetical protein
MKANIVSVSRRTDVPAFHARWFLRRLEEGFAEYRNPFGGKIHRVSLLPEDVRAFVFWTRNPAPLMRGLARIERPFYFLYTLNGYPRALERSTPPLARSIATFRRLAGRIGPERVRWRYDPILLSRETDAAFHLRNFEKIARSLEGATEECLFSFVDVYGKVRRNMAAVPEGFGLLDAPLRKRRALTRELAGIAGRYGIRLLACCEDDLVTAGAGGAGAVGKARCVDPGLIGRLAPSERPETLRPTREECGCAASRDIGAYDTCPHGCVYCYANASPEAAIRRYRKCDPALAMV